MNDVSRLQQVVRGEESVAKLKSILHDLNDQEALTQLGKKNEKGETAFMEAIRLGNEEYVKAFIESQHWQTIFKRENGINKEGNCCTCESTDTAMKELIRAMPDMAVLAMNKCITKQDNKIFNFDVSFLDECWNKKKANHALYIANSYDRTAVLCHPLTAAFASRKWRWPVFWFYSLSLIFYLAFLIPLTVFMTQNYPATAVIELQMENDTIQPNRTGNDTDDASDDLQPRQSGTENYLYVISTILALKALIKLIGDFRVHYVVIINLTELGVFGCAFAMLSQNQSIGEYLTQFDIVPVTLFLAWFNLILKLRKFPQVGIYFVMFTKIFRRFIFILFLFCPLLIGFALTFHLLLANKPLFGIERVFATIISMSSGAVRYSENLTPHFTQKNPAPHEFLAFPTGTTVALITFIILVPICFQNLLVGQAVSDVEKIRDNSTKELAMLRIDEILNYDMIWAIIGIQKKFDIEIEINTNELTAPPEGIKSWFKWLRNWVTSNVGYDERLEASFLNKVVQKNEQRKLSK